MRVTAQPDPISISTGSETVPYSFFSRTSVRIWNCLPAYVVSASDIKEFKSSAILKYASLISEYHIICDDFKPADWALAISESYH